MLCASRTVVRESHDHTVVSYEVVVCAEQGGEGYSADRCWALRPQTHGLVALRGLQVVGYRTPATTSTTKEEVRFHKCKRSGKKRIKAPSFSPRSSHTSCFYFWARCVEYITVFICCCFYFVLRVFVFFFSPRIFLTLSCQELFFFFIFSCFLGIIDRRAVETVAADLINLLGVLSPLAQYAINFYALFFSCVVCIPI